MHPGLFSDLGQKPKDLLSDDFNYDTKLEVKAPVDNGVALTSSVTRDHAKGTILGVLKTKLKPASWVVVDTTLDTAGKVQAVATMDQFADGLKIKVDDNFSARTAKATLEYIRDAFTVSASVDLTNPAKNTVAAVVGVGAVAAGVEVTDFDPTKAKVAAEFRGNNLVIAAAAAKNLDDLTLSFSQEVQDDIQLGAKYSVVRSRNAHTFELGLLYKIDRRTSLRSKIDSNGVVSVVYGQDLRPGLAVKVAGQIDTQNTAKPNNTLGVALTANL